MLQVDKLHQYYGGSHILRGLSFDVKIGEVTCLLGRNGVGKTTLLKCLMGLLPAKEGAVNWEGKAITGFKPHQRVHAGIAYVPQGREIFGRLTVEENLLMGLSRFPGSRGQGSAGVHLRTVPGAAANEATPRRRSVRRPAATAGHRPRPGQPPAPADPR